MKVTINESVQIIPCETMVAERRRGLIGFHDFTSCAGSLRRKARLRCRERTPEERKMGHITGADWMPVCTCGGNSWESAKCHWCGKSLADAEAAQAQAKREKRNKTRRDRDQARRDCGLVRGKDSMGRTIWE
jgi:hypothetical protein